MACTVLPDTPLQGTSTEAVEVGEARITDTKVMSVMIIITVVDKIAIIRVILTDDSPQPFLLFIAGHGVISTMSSSDGTEFDPRRIVVQAMRSDFVLASCCPEHYAANLTFDLSFTHLLLGSLGIDVVGARSITRDSLIE